MMRSSLRSIAAMLALLGLLTSRSPAAQSPDDEPWLHPYSGPSCSDVHAKTLDGKVLYGYQGWFNTPCDGTIFGFTHWGNGVESAGDRAIHPRHVARSLQVRRGGPMRRSGPEDAYGSPARLWPAPWRLGGSILLPTSRSARSALGLASPAPQLRTPGTDRVLPPLSSDSDRPGASSCFGSCLIRIPPSDTSRGP